MKSTQIKKILLLDDDRIQKILVEKRLLKINSGIEFVYFDTPSKALDYLKSDSVDMLLVDLNLPEMTGWEFVDEVEKVSPDSVVILQSGSVENEQIQRANSDKRISEIFEKPLSESDLRSILGL
ncbi:response regulator [Algoriphagus aquimarinus]|uniref:Response regulator receiver domain-containing protein n=1 Tax=Algoriphagus aquimarinus TaxID=237018 RepID=A0A1I0YVL4_9BACT|nr:response regulator [Algoriphagus aquimarinus]SFB16133.1 Response regulator receiver domain-containing protein [Algoriphagus aquimarinus]|tara:strand:- start:7387 stop:7758 length:372 start_codon:yes stop_codon:yes gene_type:complete